MSWNNRVVWSEGTFLQPQHFQQHDRYLEAYVEGRARSMQAHGWGLSELTLDEAALELGKLSLRSARGILPDGTPFEFPASDPSPEPLDIPLNTRDALVLLALPVRRAGMDEIDLSPRNGASLARYGASAVEVRDGNASFDRSALVQIGRMRLRLMLESERTDAYSCLGVARVLERRPDNKVILDRNFIPPCVDIHASPVLTEHARHVHGLLHQRGDTVAARAGQPGRGGVSEIAEFLYLQMMNRYEPLFAHLSSKSLLHPEQLYVTLLELAGELSTFARESRRAISYPSYRHDDLFASYAPLMDDLLRMFGWDMERRAIAIELQDRRFGVRVAVIPDLDLLKSANLVLAVNAQMPGETLRARFVPQSKIGPADKIRDLVNLALPGIGMRVLPVAPRHIPYHAGFTYYELDRTGDLWKQLERSGGLAIHVGGEFPGLEMELWAIRS
jgi:type VI secretion system protein ImpJ